MKRHDEPDSGNQGIDIRKELDKARAGIRGKTVLQLANDPDAAMEVICGDVLLAESNISGHERTWENASLAEELLTYAPGLIRSPEAIVNLCEALSRMAEATYGHPRLKLRLLKCMEQALLSMISLIADGTVTGRDAAEYEESLEEARKEASLLESNIALADSGRLSEIPSHGYLKSDPVEWTREYEAVIDEAERKIQEQLGDMPYAMGYCHAYWPVKRDVLFKDYGIRWHSPSELNPNVMFD